MMVVYFYLHLIYLLTIYSSSFKLKWGYYNVIQRKLSNFNVKMMSSVEQDTSEFKNLFYLSNPKINSKSTANYIQNWALETVNSMGFAMKASVSDIISFHILKNNFIFIIESFPRSYHFIFARTRKSFRYFCIFNN